MNDRRWTALLIFIVGGLVSAWQIYEVNHTRHFTFWVIGCIPLPIILLGILLVLGGIVGLVTGGRK